MKTKVFLSKLVMFAVSVIGLTVIGGNTVNAVDAAGGVNVGGGAFGKQYGHVDSLSSNNGSLSVSGWHTVQNQTGYFSSYRWIFLIDARTGREVARQKINRTKRPDVAKVYKNHQWGTCGYNATFNVKHLKGRTVYVMSRFTYDQNGDYRDNLWADRYFPNRTVKIR